jgi:hypothetical protein
MRGDGYLTGNVPNPSNASILQPGSNNCISVNTPSPVLLENFRIEYPQPPAVGTAAITLDSPAAQGANMDSILRDLYILSGNTGVVTLNAAGYLIDHCIFESCVSSSVLVDDSANPDNGDSTIINCRFSSGVVAQHILLESGGALRVINNKFNGGSTGGFDACIYVVVPTTFATVFIEGNSIEGCLNGIIFQRSGTNPTSTFQNVVISGNEIAAGPNPNYPGVTPHGVWFRGGDGGTPAQWLTDVVVTNNIFLISGSGCEGLDIDMTNNFLVVGNVISGDPSGSSVHLGPQVGANRVIANNIIVGFPPPQT